MEKRITLKEMNAFLTFIEDNYEYFGLESGVYFPLDYFLEKLSQHPYVNFKDVHRYLERCLVWGAEIPDQTGQLCRLQRKTLNIRGVSIRRYILVPQ